MIKYYISEGRKLKELEEPTDSCWVNISPPFSVEELEEVAIKFDIPLDFLTDSLDIDERSRYEKEEDVRLIVLNTPLVNPTEEEIDAIFITVPIGIILTPDNIFTITSYENPILKMFLEGRIKNFIVAEEDRFVLQILEQTVYRFLTCLKQLNKKRTLIEKELYDSSRNEELKQLLRIEKSLVLFVNSLSSNELLKMKMKRTDFLNIRSDEDKADLFEDIIIDNSQALEMANIYTNILNGTMDAYGSIISNNLNITMKRLTSITIILMVPTLVASFYGMNVGLPFKNEGTPHYFLIILSISLILSGLLAWYFQRNRLF
jgi:magnesium transporter